MIIFEYRYSRHRIYASIYLPAFPAPNQVLWHEILQGLNKPATGCKVDRESKDGAHTLVYSLNE
jgi:hypothetical protein